MQDWRREDRTGEVSEEVLMSCTRLEATGQERSVRRWAVSSPGGASGHRWSSEAADRCDREGQRRQDNFRAHAPIVGRLELPFRRHEEGSVEQ